jgi:hypothetical protein
MTKGVIRSALTCVLIAFLWLDTSAIGPAQDAPSNIKLIVEKIDRVSENEVHFWLSLRNASASPIYLEGRALLRISSQPFTEQLFLEQWKDGEWHLVVPCLENAPPDIIRLNPGTTISQERGLTNPLNAPCKVRQVIFAGTFRFRLNYFLSEKDARANERNFDLSRPNRPAPHAALSDSFEIPEGSSHLPYAQPE